VWEHEVEDNAGEILCRVNQLTHSRPPAYPGGGPSALDCETRDRPG
jgi:hypothetical protein